MHAHHTFITHAKRGRCDEPSRFPAWLRLAASDIQTALSWHWLAYLGACILRMQWRSIGTTAVLVPSITGAEDHSTLIDGAPSPAPMAFRGGRHRNNTCNDDAPNTMPVHMHDRSIYTTRLARMVRARLLNFGAEWCMSPAHSIARSRVRGGAAT